MLLNVLRTSLWKTQKTTDFILFSPLKCQCISIMKSVDEEEQLLAKKNNPPICSSRKHSSYIGYTQAYFAKMWLNHYIFPE